MAAYAAAVYLAARPFVKIRFLKKDVEDDLRDYYRSVRDLHHPVLRMMQVLRDNERLTDDRQERFSIAYRSIVNIRTWDDVALADRLSTDAMDEAIATLERVGVAHDKRKYDEVCYRYNDTQDALTGTRRLLFRDIPKLNRSFVHWFPWLAVLMKIPRYPMSETIPWNPGRVARGPRLETLYCMRSA